MTVTYLHPSIVLANSGWVKEQMDKNSCSLFLSFSHFSKSQIKIGFRNFSKSQFFFSLSRIFRNLEVGADSKISPSLKVFNHIKLQFSTYIFLPYFLSLWLCCSFPRSLPPSPSPASPLIILHSD